MGYTQNKDVKLQLTKFSTKETYKGLGTGINEWIERFVRQLELAQLDSGFCWGESVKMDVLEDHLEGKALELWQIKRKTWENSTLEEAMNALKMNYRCTLPDRQVMTLFDKEKPSHRGFKEHYYLVKELGMNMQLPMKLRMDNQAAITCIMNEASSSKTKDVDIKHKYVKDLYQHIIIMPSYIPTTEMRVNILTKIMPGVTFVLLRTMIEINPPKIRSVVEC
jgi:hypothetical protein